MDLEKIEREFKKSLIIDKGRTGGTDLNNLNNAVEKQQYEFKFSDEPKEKTLLQRILKKTSTTDILKSDNVSLMLILFDNGQIKSDQEKFNDFLLHEINSINLKRGLDSPDGNDDET